jgi:hypothetical protein
MFANVINTADINFITSYFQFIASPSILMIKEAPSSYLIFKFQIHPSKQHPLWVLIKLLIIGRSYHK